MLQPWQRERVLHPGGICWWTAVDDTADFDSQLSRQGGRAPLSRGHLPKRCAVEQVMNDRTLAAPIAAMALTEQPRVFLAAFGDIAISTLVTFVILCYKKAHT